MRNDAMMKLWHTKKKVKLFTSPSICFGSVKVKANQISAFIEDSDAWILCVSQKLALSH